MRTYVGKWSNVHIYAPEAANYGLLQYNYLNQVENTKEAKRSENEFLRFD